jgi:Protein of unknown function (DUF3551)
MRTVIVVVLALLGMVLTVTSADAGAWCANYRRGVSNCGYSSYAQCFATVQGLGQDTVRRTPSPEPHMGRRLEAGTVASHPGAIGGTIRRKTHVGGFCP